MKWLKLAAWLVVAVALIFLQDAVSLARHGFRVMPTLIMNLPGAESDYAQKFDIAIKQRFPTGSDEKALIAYLADQGFHPDWRHGTGPNTASFAYDGLICSKRAHVSWLGDANGKLIDVGASYESVCAVEQPYAQSLKTRS